MEFLLRPFDTMMYRYTDAIFRDLENMHFALKRLSRNAGFPEPGILHTKALRNPELTLTPANGCPLAVDPEIEDLEDSNSGSGAQCGNSRDLSRDGSPDLSPEDDPNVPQVPIQSLYALTRLRALRSPDNVLHGHHTGGAALDDFISRGAFRLEDAERLFLMYRDRLDAFMFRVGCPYRTLDELRSKSPVLTAAILTVAALHDPLADPIYSVCSTEFRHLIERSIFRRSVNRDYLRALCVASYWLSDMSWMLSGYVRHTPCI